MAHDVLKLRKSMGGNGKVEETPLDEGKLDLGEVMERGAMGA